MRRCERPLKEEELEAAMHDLQQNKSPGRDGLQKEFYALAQFWSQVKGSLTNMANAAFESEQLSPTVNMGLIRLIPSKGKAWGL